MKIIDWAQGLASKFGFSARRPVPSADASERTPGDVPGFANLILCNDAERLHTRGKSIVKQLNHQGHDVNIDCVEDEKSLLKHLRKREKSGAPPPDAIFLDVGGVGERTATKFIKWYENQFPDRPLPEINFLSLDVGMGITEAGRLRESDPRVNAGFVAEEELTWLDKHLKGERIDKKWDIPAGTAFRDILNARLGIKIPLQHEPGYYAPIIQKMQQVSNDRVMTAWRSGKMPAEEALGRMRDYAQGLAKALHGGFYGTAQTASDIPKDAEFYGSAGFPVKGPVLFDVQELDSAYYESARKGTEKPVLVMQSYDPAVMPILASGKLGGLVVTSPYMASHLKLLCETHMVSGLFGVKPPSERGMRASFNEDAKPEGPAYYKGDMANIAGHALHKGQMVMVGAGNDGLQFNPKAEAVTAPVDFDAVTRDEKLKEDLRKLQQVNDCFAAYFEEKGATAHGVKANIDANAKRVLPHVRGIGLVRTEQMVVSAYGQRDMLAAYLLKDDKSELGELMTETHYSYMEIIRHLDRGHPVKMRLFDFVHEEVLNKDEQNRFAEKYGRLDIHGGAALDAWPDLYRLQARTIFEAMNSVDIWSDRPLEIMMPAVRTEDDVKAIKAIVFEEAEKMGIATAKFSFGVMVETLEACENIATIAPHCDFISFGTNDLTQQYVGISRSDLKAQARFAEREGYDPFKKLSPDILAIMQKTAEAGRAAKPGLKVDVCGQQGADLETAGKLFAAGIDNVSVAPNIVNLYALPVLLNYQVFDKLQPKANVQIPPPQAQNG